MRDYREVMRTAQAGTDCDASALARIEAASRRGRRGRTWIAVAAVALAAALLLYVRPLPALDRSLDHAGAVDLGPYVAVASDGTGAVAGNERSMQVEWDGGTLGVEVEPGRGVGLEVRTPDGVARVVGTGFDVERDALGTTVRVRHGRVAVDCVRGDDRELQAGESLVCRPPTAAGRLGRLIALRGDVGAPAFVAEIDDALALPDAEGAVAAELRILRVSAYLSSGRSDNALTEAEAALVLPNVTRAVELHRFAARLRMARHDCAGALPHFVALDAAGELADDAAAYAACVTPR